MAGLGAPELLIVLVLVLLIFGGSKLPQMARSLGSAKKEFERGRADSDPPTSRDAA
jgi:sec-independent protein translocase protein TatA